MNECLNIFTKMACKAVNSWTFADLVAAFLDLSIAYCLLCASAFSYLASRFLGLFGLCLPCPCDGMFWNPAEDTHCLQRHLVNCPFEKISLVHSAAMTKTPFETLRADHSDRDPNGDPEDVFKSGVEFGAVNVEGLKERRVVGRWMRHGLRRRRRGGLVNYGKISSVSSYDTLRSDARNAPQSPPSIAKNGNHRVSGDANDFGGDKEATLDFGLDLNDLDANKRVCRGEIPIEELGIKKLGDVVGVEGNVKHIIRVLERSLEEEQIARSAMYVELEKERSAAASAADEAMAMILRLQAEKASVEMEARQYQRMIEAKAAYDAEEMNIMKEILLRREREKHYLEKEVEEAYRQIMALENDQSDSEDPMAMLQKMNESAEKPKLNRTLAFEKELALPELGESDESLKESDVHDEPPKVSGDSKSSELQYQESKEPPNPMLNGESRVYDVHVIDEESKRSRKFGSSSFSALETLCAVSRSSSDITSGLPPTGFSTRVKVKVSDLRRNSMSAVDCERVKIDNEVECLRERLRVVQKGREKLNFSAGQLQEKAERQAWLPPSYSKATSKKRRWRSASLNVHQSN